MTETKIGKVKTWSDVISTWVAIVGALIGGFLAVFQYIENSQAEKVRQTLVFVERFGDSKLMGVRKAYDDVFNHYENQQNINEAFRKGEKNGSDYVLKLVYDRDLDEDLFALFDFYDQLYVCVYSGLCDKDVAIQFFGKYAFDLGGTLYPYIEKTKADTSDSSIGNGVMYFFKAYNKQRKADAKSNNP